MNVSGSVFNAEGKIDRLAIVTIDAYGVAVKNGFKGTVEEWLESLKGDPGVVDVVSAKPGQIILVKNVDKNGRPTEWEATDLSWDYLKNKPFQETVELYNNPNFNIDDVGVGYAEVGSDFLVEGETYEIELNGKCCTGVCVAQESGDRSWLWIGSNEIGVGQYPNSTEIVVSSSSFNDGNFPLKISKAFVKLDSKYIDLSWSDLKDRPFYDGTAVMYENSEFWIDAEGYGSAEAGSNFLETGVTYEVEFNGNHYTCVCTEQRYGDQVVCLIVGEDVRISQQEGIDQINVSVDAEVIYNVFVPLKITKVAIKKLDSEYVDLSGYAKTVNGTAPDENGNVQIDTASSWNELKDKPFGEETVVLYENPALYVEEDSASENITTNFLEEGETYTVEVDGKPYSLVCEISDDMEFTGNVYYCLTSDNFEVYTALPDLFFEFYSKDYNNKTISLKISKPSIKKIDNKYLPEPLQFGDEYVVLYENEAMFLESEWSDGTPPGMCRVPIESNFLVDGETYDVEVNGNRYSCECVYYEDDPSEWWELDFGDTCVSTHQGYNGWRLYVDSEEFANTTISLKISKHIIKKIDNMYLDMDAIREEVGGEGSGGNVDLTGYATEQWVNDQKYLTEVPEDYAKTSDVPTDEHIIDLIEENAPESSGSGISVTGASVGQTVQIAAVDENGVPTAWEPVDFPSGGSSGGLDYEYINTVSIEEDEVTSYDLDLGAEYREVMLTTLVASASSEGSQVLTTTGSLKFFVMNGNSYLTSDINNVISGTALSSTIAPTASRQYSYVIRDTGIFVELSELQTLISGGCQTANIKTAILKKCDPSNYARMNRIKITANYFFKGAKLYVYGVRA